MTRNRVPSGTGIRFFDSLPAESLGRPAIIALAHVIPGCHEFLYGLDHFGEVRLVLAKPHSMAPAYFSSVAREYDVEVADRSRFANEAYVLDLIHSHTRDDRFVLVDVGGYFAPSLESIYERFGNRFLGVVEDTENGLARYQATNSTVPIVSVARSPLKSAEDYLVGRWVVNSFEEVVRDHGRALQGGVAAVIGYGRVGSSVCEHLRTAQCHVIVVERDPIRRVSAVAHGFEVADLSQALKQADFVISATGARAIGADSIRSVRRGAFLAGVTSVDDEFDFGDLRQHFASLKVSPTVERLSSEEAQFYLVNEGNAVNFLTEGRMVAHLLPVFGEVALAVGYLVSETLPGGIHELPDAMRETIAHLWLREFGGATASPDRTNRTAS